MRQNLLIGAGLGLVAAVVFASATTGIFAARVVLFFITPLPLALAGLGWGPRAAAVAGAVGTLLVGVWAGPVVALTFAVSQVVPMVVLSYLALLARSLPPEGAGPAALEWYPIGRLVVWAAIIAALLSFASILLIGGDMEKLKGLLTEVFRTAIKDGMATMPDGAQVSDSDIQAMAEVALAVLPLASAASWISSLLFNLWLAGRITLASGQLIRPWPDLSGIEFPKGSALLFGAALLGIMLDGYPEQLAKAFAGALFVAFVLLGLAVIHSTTRGQPWRPFALWGLYGVLLLFNFWVAVPIALIGILEPVFNFRARYAGSPPADSST
jgi:hypothetical protein